MKVEKGWGKVRVGRVGRVGGRIGCKGRVWIGR